MFQIGGDIEELLVAEDDSLIHYPSQKSYTINFPLPFSEIGAHIYTLAN
jgi:hypothetical protein